MQFDVIAELSDPGHPAFHEALEEVNAELSGSYRVLAHYEQGQGLNSQWYLVEERDDDQ